MQEKPPLHSDLRMDRPELKGLGLALALSLAIHLAVFGGYKLVRHYGWMQQLHLPAWLERLQKVQEAKKKQSPPAEREAPLMFVEVTPAVATPDTPEDAKYYSSRNSRAANTESDVDSNIPKITGRQEHVPKADDTPRGGAQPLQPATPPEAPSERLVDDAKPASAQPPGDLALAKPETTLRLGEGRSTETKPRTVAEAKARLESVRIPGEKMKQEGGVRRRALVPSFDAKATPFGAYDEAIVNAVTRRWYDLLDSRDFARDRTGRVMLRFRLNFDGRVTDMAVLEGDVGELLSLLCQKAVLDPAPYAAWPSDMRRLVGADYRLLTFTFYYY